MIYLNLREVKPGMVLAEPVENHQGMLLLNRGTELSSKNVRVLKSWGVIKVYVEGEDNEGIKNANEHERKVREAIERGLKERFIEVLEDPVMVEIMRVAIRRLEKRALEEETKNEPR